MKKVFEFYLCKIKMLHNFYHHIYYLKNRQNRDNQIADSTRKEMQDKMKEVQQQPGSLATTGGQQVETSPDDAIFNSILGSDKQLDNLFG